MGNKRPFKRRLMRLLTCFTPNSLRNLPSSRSSSFRHGESGNKIAPHTSLPPASPYRTPSRSPYHRKGSHSAPLPTPPSRGNHYRMGTEEREESLKEVIEYCKVFGHVPLRE